MANDWNDTRPLSPHIMNWKWHITMASSIFHRASGVALYIGSFLIVGWLVAITMGEAAYNGYAGFLGSPIGLILLFAFTAAVMYHLANGIRHLFWDAGTGYKPGTANLTAWLVILFAAVSSVAIWAYILFGMGG
ncbi:succinate dehydrogenase, cytochrome b556 subunit [Ponticaulis sp.]|uniref:succinate dehydrogenase, cytochrome b556 subunit n=1 Tax=Ponticaulis sp. TaxID=2020902 RepID=UPI000C642353|nr:succinate dehydrogenase, cytochrome b556 subunit [Ponticaulis sp.]MAF58278.1 succinate dehydrogenase, cytochrome b556 subunit [Ponticaulis sp.]MBN03596.1 succinate dehydrogenase, cytochrome b556 subunit [Ponticaulis sp.]